MPGAQWKKNLDHLKQWVMRVSLGGYHSWPQGSLVREGWVSLGGYHSWTQGSLSREGWVLLTSSFIHGPQGGAPILGRSGLGCPGWATSVVMTKVLPYPPTLGHLIGQKHQEQPNQKNFNFHPKTLTFSKNKAKRVKVLKPY